MEKMYRTIKHITIDDKIKKDLIAKEWEKRIVECEKVLNKTLVDKFYKKLTDKMWVRIANKKLFYVDGGEVDKENGNIKLLVADTTRIVLNCDGNCPDEIEGYKCRLLTKEEATFIFYQQKKHSPIFTKDRNHIVYIDEKRMDELVWKKLQDMVKSGKGIVKYPTIKTKDYIKIKPSRRSILSRYYDFNLSNGEFKDSEYGAIVPVINIKKASSKLETFFLNNLIPEGFSKEEEVLYKKCLKLWKQEYCVFGEAGQLQITDKFINMVHEGNYSELAGFSFLKKDIEDSIFKNNRIINLIEEIILSDYLDCDYRRAGIDRYDRKLLEDAKRGHWDLWEDIGSRGDMIQISTPLVGRNPLVDVHWDGIVGIDFGTRSTVVVYQNGNANMHFMRIGSGNYKKEAKDTDYESPTVMHFIHIEHFLKLYKAKKGRPNTVWDDVNISHTAAEALKTASSGEYYSYFSDLKQWCGDKNRQVRIRDKDGVEKTLPTFTELEEGSFNPIEFYAYFLGLFINNMRHGIFLDYILSFPVTYEKAVRDKILQSFRNGLWKSLPVHVQCDKKVADSFCVNQGASESAAYAACALTEYGFDPEEGKKFFYGIFDFGGGTTDFDFGLWRAPANAKEARRYDYVVEHFGASSDQYLGGENLLELLAFSVFKKNKSILREKDISFTKPHDCANLPGSEILVKDSQEAKFNTRQLMEVLRGLWEHNNLEQIRNIESGTVKVQLFSNKGERLHNFELKVNKSELEQILRNRIKEGVDNFFNALKLNFERNDMAECNCVNIFLAGNSSKSPLVWEVFKEQIASRTERLYKKLKAEGKEIDTEHLYYKIFPPLGITEEDIKRQNEIIAEDKKTKEKKLKSLKPTGKTGVAYGLLLCRKGGKIKDIPEKKQDDEAKFRYYLGREKKGCFKVTINTSVKYGQWTEFIDASVDRFDIYYSSSPNSTTNQLSIRSSSVFLKKCTIMKENQNASIYIRTVAPTTIEYAVATEEGIKEGRFLEQPTKIDLNNA